MGGKGVAHPLYLPSVTLVKDQPESSEALASGERLFSHNTRSLVQPNTCRLMFVINCKNKSHESVCVVLCYVLFNARMCFVFFCSTEND